MSPLDVPDCDLWFDYTSVFSQTSDNTTPCTTTGQNCQFISDLSGNGNHGVLSSGAPTIYRSAQIGGKPCMRGSSSVIQFAGVNRAYTDFTMFMVCQKPAIADGTFARWVDKIFTSGFFVTRSTTEDGWHSGVEALGTDLASADDTGPFILCLTRSGTTKTLYINGETTNAAETVSGSAMTTDPLCLFNLAAEGAGSSGDIAALTMHARAMTLIQRAIVWTYLSVPYGITLAGVTPPGNKLSQRTYPRGMLRGVTRGTS